MPPVLTKSFDFFGQAHGLVRHDALKHGHAFFQMPDLTAERFILVT
jgi:hypothetical protein